jgi:hypothetical protein
MHELALFSQASFIERSGDSGARTDVTTGSNVSHAAADGAYGTVRQEYILLTGKPSKLQYH